MRALRPDAGRRPRWIWHRAVSSSKAACTRHAGAPDGLLRELKFDHRGNGIHRLAQRGQPLGGRRRGQHRVTVGRPDREYGTPTRTTVLRDRRCRVSAPSTSSRSGNGKSRALPRSARTTPSPGLRGPPVGLRSPVLPARRATPARSARGYGSSGNHSHTLIRSPVRQRNTNRPEPAMSTHSVILATVPTSQRMSPPPTSRPCEISTTPNRGSVVAHAVSYQRGIAGFEDLHRQILAGQQRRLQREHRHRGRFGCGRHQISSSPTSASTTARRSPSCSSATRRCR